MRKLKINLPQIIILLILIALIVVIVMQLTGPTIGNVFNAIDGNCGGTLCSPD